MFIAMLLFVLVTLSCVSANDINETDDTVAMDDTITEEITSASEVGTFTELEREINTTTTNVLELDKDYTYNSDTDENFVSGIHIRPSPFTVDGKGHTIDANKLASSVFYQDTTDLTLKNLIIKNCKGSAIPETYNRILKVYNCTFINNQGGRYGAFGGSHGTVENSTFINNSGSTTAGISFSSGTVRNCTFINNTGGAYGAVHLSSGSVHDTKFIHNI